MAKNYIQQGKRMTYTNGGNTDIKSGDVVLVNSVIGIALYDIPASKDGELAVEEVWNIPKETGAISQGAKVYWDADGDPVGGVAGTGAATTVASEGDPAVENTYIGFAFHSAGSDDSLVKVKINV